MINKVNRVTLSEGDISLLAESITKIIANENFFIDPEEHYNSHKKLDKFLSSWEEIESKVRNYIINIILIGVVVMFSFVLPLDKIFL